MEVESSWRVDGGAAVAAAFLPRDDAAQHDATPPRGTHQMSVKMLMAPRTSCDGLQGPPETVTSGVVDPSARCPYWYPTRL